MLDWRNSIGGQPIDAVTQVHGEITPEEVMEGLRVGLYGGGVLPTAALSLLTEYANKPGRNITISD